MPGGAAAAPPSAPAGGPAARPPRPPAPRPHRPQRPSPAVLRGHPRHRPRGANMPQQLGYDYFVTMWGSGGELTDYTGKTPKMTPIKVASSTGARPPFMEADVPLPAGLKLGSWRTYVGAGLWDPSNAAWKHPDPSPQQT